MNLLLHHFRKDLRYARWMILFTFVLAAGAFWFPSVPLEERSEQIKWLSFSRYGSWLMALLTAGHLVQLDAPLRESGFMRTRPAPRAKVFQSKMLAVFVLIVPLAMTECIMLVLLDLKPDVTTLILVFAENLLALAMICAAGMALAIRSETSARFYVSVVGCIGIGVIGWHTFKLGETLYIQKKDDDWSYTLEYLKSSRVLMAQVVALIGSVISIGFFVHSGRCETITKSLVITAVCSLATEFFWPLNFVEVFAPPHREAPKNEWPDTSKLKFEFEAHRQWNSIIACIRRDAFNDDTVQPIFGNGRLTGLTEGWRHSFDNSHKSVLTLSNGKALSSSREARGVLLMAILPTLGIPSPQEVFDKHISAFQLAEFKLQDAAGAMTGAHLNGTMDIPLKRPVILARMPFRQGNFMQLGDQRIELTKVRTDLDEFEYNIVQQRPLIKLRGSWFNHDGGNIEFIVIHAARKEFLYQGGTYSRYENTGHYGIVTRVESKSIWTTGNNTKPIPPDWTDGAELLVIGNENGGSFSQSFEFENINLSNEP